MAEKKACFHSDSLVACSNGVKSILDQEYIRYLTDILDAFNMPQ